MLRVSEKSRTSASRSRLSGSSSSKTNRKCSRVGGRRSNESRSTGRPSKDHSGIGSRSGSTASRPSKDGMHQTVRPSLEADRSSRCGKVCKQGNEGDNAASDPSCTRGKTSLSLPCLGFGGVVLLVIVILIVYISMDDRSSVANTQAAAVSLEGNGDIQQDDVDCAWNDAKNMCFEGTLNGATQTFWVVSSQTHLLNMLDREHIVAIEEGGKKVGYTLKKINTGDQEQIGTYTDEQGTSKQMTHQQYGYCFPTRGGECPLPTGAKEGDVEWERYTLPVRVFIGISRPEFFDDGSLKPSSYAHFKFDKEDDFLDVKTDVTGLSNCQATLAVTAMGTTGEMSKYKEEEGNGIRFKPDGFVGSPENEKCKEHWNFGFNETMKAEDAECWLNKPLTDSECLLKEPTSTSPESESDFHKKWMKWRHDGTEQNSWFCDISGDMGAGCSAWTFFQTTEKYFWLGEGQAANGVAGWTNDTERNEACKAALLKTTNTDTVKPSNVGFSMTQYNAEIHAAIEAVAPGWDGEFDPEMKDKLFAQVKRDGNVSAQLPKRGEKIFRTSDSEEYLLQTAGVAIYTSAWDNNDLAKAVVSTGTMHMAGCSVDKNKDHPEVCDADNAQVSFSDWKITATAVTTLQKPWNCENDYSPDFGSCADNDKSGEKSCSTRLTDGLENKQTRKEVMRLHPKCGCLSPSDPAAALAVDSSDFGSCTDTDKSGEKSCSTHLTWGLANEETREQVIAGHSECGCLSLSTPAPTE